MTNFKATDINCGFLLTRQVQDTAKGLQITLWLKSHCGVAQLQINNELAVFFIENHQLESAQRILVNQQIPLEKSKQLSLKTFAQQKVAALYFTSMRSFYRARDALKYQQIKCYEDDIRADDRFLMERHITADITYTGDFISDSIGRVGGDYIVSNESFKNDKPRKDYQLVKQAKCKRATTADEIQLTMLSIDIECSMNGELYSIGLYACNSTASGTKEEFKRVLMIGKAQLNCESYIHWLADEKQLLQQFIDEVTLFDADIFIGWNVINFDFYLLQKRCDLHGVKFAIGRDGSKPYWRKNANNTEQNFIEIAGRVVLDGIDLLKTATYSFPSFSLDNVAHTLLGIGKKVSDVENRVQEITDNFYHNKAELAAYNLEDCRLVWLIFEKTQLLAFAQLRAQLTGLAIDRIGGSVAAFTNLYLPKLHRSGYIAPNMGDGVSDLVSPGGYVMDSIPGLYENVLVLDFKSLYPSIIRTFKIDPMGLIEGLAVVNEPSSNKDNTEQDDKDNRNYVIKGFDGAYFSRTAHFLPDIIESLWLERDKAKLQKNAALSQAIKIIMNSFYGVLGSTGCRFFDPRLSGSITKRSHEILKTTSNWISEQGHQVIYGDTDSIFVFIGADKSKQQAQQLGLSLQSFINKKWRATLQQDFKITSQLDIEFETHFTKFLMPKIRGLNNLKDQKVIGTKKRYAGISNEIMIFKGLETVRSDWTELSKDFQQELYRLVFNDEPIEEYIQSVVTDLKAGLYDDKLIYQKKIRRKLNDYVNTPPHIKAALIANIKLDEQGKKPKYKHRSTIRYVITLDGVQPLEFNESKLDYDFYVEKQLKPIADDILPFIGRDFESISGDQLGLF
ncbi:DNA polymerase II [Colwellia psychrerythraea]|uniref:DNA polymerase n=1 Tax=Colwellia psychrerythraea TaxID=28229 RepID=A0A099KDS4_COLPS|nr:DNA polymerase II [Colwellia psychrerythraea]KGJ87723.1 DNA polymerase B region [Colwellia psychrerythraea]